MTATNVRSQQKLNIALWGMDGFHKQLKVNCVRNNQTSQITLREGLGPSGWWNLARPTVSVKSTSNVI